MLTNTQSYKIFDNFLQKKSTLVHWLATTVGIQYTYRHVRRWESRHSL